MSVIIRLQNLPWSANALDIRQFFRGLNIPEGGVHIVGGENGDAFIAFSTDEDARQAMRLDGGKLKEVQVHLLLSSRAEMQKVIETARQTTMQYVSLTTPAPVTQPVAQPKPNIQQAPLTVQPSAIPTAQNLPTHQQQLMSSQQIQVMQHQAIKPQPPVITSNSLSGILAHQMFQQQQMQMMSQQQNMPLMTSTSVRHDNYNTQTKPYSSMNLPNQPENNLLESKENINQKKGLVDPYEKRRDDEYAKRRSSRSRSKSRERRDRRRSRSRERRTRHRDRSRSRERRHKRRNRSRSRNRDRSRDRDRPRSRDRNRSFEKDDRSSSRNFESVKSPDMYKGNVSQGDSSDVEKKHSMNPWDGSNSNNQQPIGIMQNFSSGQMGMMDAGMNKPISLFTNMYNQPDANCGQSSMNPMNVCSPNSNFDNQRHENPFDPVMPMIPYGNLSDQNRSGGMMRKEPSNSENQTCCLRIKNIGGDTHYSNLRRFFSGYHIPNDGIKLLNDQYGNRIGEAVIRFLRPEIARSALSKDGTLINNINAVNIKMIPMEEYDDEVDSYRPPRGSYGNERNRGFNRDQGFRSGGGGRQFNDNDDDSRRSNRGRFSEDRRERNDDDHRRDRNDYKDDQRTMSNRSRDSIKTSALMVEGLPSSLSDDDIRKMFSKFAVLQVIIPDTTSDFHAYVKLGSCDEAQTASNDAYRIGYKPVFVSLCSEDIYARIAKDCGVVAAMTREQKKLDAKKDSQKSVIEIDDDDEDDNSKEADTAADNKRENDDVMDMSEDVENEERRSAHEENSQDNENNGDNQNKFNVQQTNSTNQFTNNANFIGQNDQRSGGDPSNSNTGIPSLIDMSFDKPNGPPNFLQGLPNVNSSDPRLKRGELNYSNTYSMADNKKPPNVSSNRGQHEDTNFISILNMEYKTSERDLMELFDTIGLTPKQIYMLRNPRGLPNGNCYCEFELKNDARKALAKNRTRLGSRTIFINLVPRERVACDFPLDDKDTHQSNEGKSKQNDDDNVDEADDLGKNDGDQMNDGNEGSENDDKDNDEDDSKDENDDDESAMQRSSKDKNSSASGHKNPFRQGRSKNDNSQDNSSNSNLNASSESDRDNNMQPNRNQFMPMNNNNMMNPAMRGDNSMNYGNRGQNMMNYNGANGGNDGGGGDGNFGGGGGGAGGGNGNCNGPNNFGNMGCVVELRNVPYKASIGDILQLFNGFPVSPNNVIRRYNDDGTPTGDARVCFNSPMQARMAMDRNRNSRIMGRHIYLGIVS